MPVVTMEDIIESNRIKKEICDNYMDALKDKLTPEQLQKFEDVFYSTAKGYLFSIKIFMLIRKIGRNSDVSML